MTTVTRLLTLALIEASAGETLSPAKRTALRLLRSSHPLLADLHAAMTDAETIAYTVDRVAQWVEDARRAWVSHPDYVQAVSYRPGVLDPTVVTVWRHAPGYNNSEYSYAFVSLSLALSPGLETRMRRYLGREIQLVAIGGVPPELHCSPFRETYYVGAFGPRAQAYEARMQLKMRLPRRTHKVINAARRLNRRPKWSFWQSRVSRDEWNVLRDSGAVRQRNRQPKWYRKHPKKALAIVQLRREYPVEMQRIEQVISAEDFWDCATGHVHPNDVPEKFKVRQLPLC